MACPIDRASSTHNFFYHGERRTNPLHDRSDGSDHDGRPPPHRLCIDPGPADSPCLTSWARLRQAEEGFPLCSRITACRANDRRDDLSGQLLRRRRPPFRSCDPSCPASAQPSERRPSSLLCECLLCCVCVAEWNNHGGSKGIRDRFSMKW